MEKFTAKIRSLLQDKLLYYQKLKTVIEEEKKYVVEMNVEKMWKTIAQKKELTTEIEGVIQEIKGLFETHLFPLQSDSETFQLSRAIEKIPTSPKARADLKAVCFSINACKEDISLLAKENKRYVAEYLSVIDGIFSTVVNFKRKSQYSHSGQMVSGKDNVSLINAEV